MDSILELHFRELNKTKNREVRKVIFDLMVKIALVHGATPKMAERMLRFGAPHQELLFAASLLSDLAGEKAKNEFDDLYLGSIAFIGKVSRPPVEVKDPCRTEKKPRSS